MREGRAVALEEQHLSRDGVPSRRQAPRMRYLLLAVLIMFGRAESTPLQVYGRLPNLENVAISPDGAHLAFVRTDADARVLAVVSLETGKLVAAARVGKAKLRDVNWADDKRLIIITS